VFLEEYPWRAQMALNPEVELCTACAITVHTLKLRIYKPDKPWVITIPCFSARFAKDNISNQPNL
jgi:hypothetical protein